MKYKLLIIWLLFCSCDLILGWNERWGFEYRNLSLYHRAKVGGIWVYYLENDGRTARIAFENRFNDQWIGESWEAEKYSYEKGWVEYHVSQIRREYIRIGWKKP